MSRTERGFTLIELLVVILIIAILAAVAIPIFLRQREKGWETQMRSALRDAATAMESHLLDRGSYAAGGMNSGNLDTVRPLLAAQGYQIPPWVATFNIRARGDQSYCIHIQHSQLTASSDWRNSTYWSLGPPSGPYVGQSRPVPRPDNCSAQPNL